LTSNPQSFSIFLRVLPKNFGEQWRKDEVIMKRAKVVLSVVLFACSFFALIAAAAPTWTLLGPSGLTFPLLRGGSTAVYDPSSNRIILFSGASADLGNAKLNDVWVETDANGLGGTGAWSNLIPDGAAGSPPGRYNHSAVYDVANNRMIIFGGCLGGCLPVDNAVWVLSNANGLGGTPTWTQLFPTGAPPPARQGHQAVYDPNTNSMIVWAGQDGGGSFCGTYSDVWVLSNANGLGGTPSWTRLLTSGGHPPGQYFSSAVYDPVNNVLTVFGGFGHHGSNCGVRSNAVWALSNANGTGGTPVWTNLVPQGAPGSPANRDHAFAVYEADTNTMTIFGGSTNNGGLNDAWVLSHANGIGGASTWTRLATPPPLPVSAGRWNNGGFDGVNNRMIMFGGNLPEGPLWGTWVLPDPSGQ
jgi:Galactose oxidase, central domain